METYEFSKYWGYIVVKEIIKIEDVNELDSNIVNLKKKLPYESPKVYSFACSNIIEGGGPFALESQGGGLLS
ncbi:MAG: hypothetical protein E6Q33_10910 [Neisseriales bacterium]|nr:MAG: hypothetical protein E6Q33_10910 [Neisseriales bacterium]